MEYDEIDQYVDQLFRNSEDRSQNEPLNGEVLSGDWRIDRIDQIIQDTYDEAIWWHNQRISEGTDPRSGLRNLPYIPWDENIDGVAAMGGGVGGLADTSARRNGTTVRSGSHRISNSTVSVSAKNRLTLGEVILVLSVIVGLLLFMMIAS